MTKVSRMARCHCMTCMHTVNPFLELHLRSVWHYLPLWDHSVCVTCHLTQWNTPHLNSSHPGQCLIYLPRKDGRLSWSRWLVGCTQCDRPSLTFNCLQTVVQLRTKWARRPAVFLIKTNVLTSTPGYHLTLDFHPTVSVSVFVEMSLVTSQRGS